MIIANTLGYEASTESIVTLQQLLAALNTFPAAWAEAMPINATLVGNDVSSPQFSPESWTLTSLALSNLVLFPSDMWLNAESAWRDVSIVVDGRDVRPFGLEAPTIREAKERTQALLQDYESSVPKPPVTEPMLPGIEPVEPLPVAPTPEPTPAPPTVPPTTVPPTTVPPTTAAIQPVKGVPGWAWAALSAVGLGTIVALVVGTSKSKRRLGDASTVEWCEYTRRRFHYGVENNWFCLANGYANRAEEEACPWVKSAKKQISQAHQQCAGRRQRSK